MKLNLTYITGIILILIVGCQEYYEPKIDHKSGNLVVEAMLTDRKDIFTVKLSRTIAHNQSLKYSWEKNAEVFVLSVNGESYNFEENSEGTYKSVDSIEAKTGEAYYLHIITNDGNEYMSEVEEMVEPCNIDKIQITDTTTVEVTYDAWQDTHTTNVKGINISVMPSTPTQPDVGFLYQWNSLINYEVISTDKMYMYYYYCWFKLKSSHYQVYNYNNKESGYSLGSDKLDFYSYYGDLSPQPIDSSRFIPDVKKIYTSSFYYLLRQYTITLAGASFWKSVKAQSEVTGKLFDPVEEQIPTNIYCITDTTKEAFGFFNTAAYTAKILLVRIVADSLLFKKNIPDYYPYEIKEVNVFPVPEKAEDCLLNEVTEFWY